MQNPDGTHTFVRAELDANGQLKPAVGPSGKLEVVGNISDAVDKVKEVPLASSAEDSPVVVVNEGGEAVPAVLDKDGTHFRVGLNKFGQLEAVRDAQGMKIRLSAQGGPAPSLKTIVEEHDEISPPHTPMEGEQRNSAMSPEQDELAAQLRAKLEKYQEQTVGGGNTGDASPDKAKLKAELKDKTTRAERKRLARLKKASEKAEDDGIIEETFANMSDEIKYNREKVKKAKQLLKAARAEAADLTAEFERERDFLLEDLRKQNQLIKFQAAVLERTQPLIRRDCNYFNLDKIRAAAVWDDEKQDWGMPKLTTAGASSMPAVSACS